MPIFWQGIPHWRVDHLCKAYGHVETTGTIQSLKLAVGDARGMPRSEGLSVCEAGEYEP